MHCSILPLEMFLMNKIYPSVAVKKYTEGIRFYPVNKLISQFVTVTQMLAKNARFLNQKKRILLLMTKQQPEVSVGLLWLPCPLIPVEIMQVGLNECLHKLWATFKEKNTELEAKLL